MKSFPVAVVLSTAVCLLAPPLVLAEDATPLDDIVITADGNENLTASVVKDPDAIEALMAAAR